MFSLKHIELFLSVYSVIKSFLDNKKKWLYWTWIEQGNKNGMSMAWLWRTFRSTFIFNTVISQITLYCKILSILR